MIGLIDSGIGGLSILQYLLVAKPDAATCYLADQAHMPYGEKPASFIQSRVLKLVEYLIDLQATIIVLACNTATVNTPISLLRRLYPQTKFVGVEPPFKPMSVAGGNSLLLTTPATASSDWLCSRLETYPNIQLLPCPGLAEVIEEDMHLDMRDYLNHLTKNTNIRNFTSVGIGCTHYSLIKSQLESFFKPLPLFDPSQAVVKQIISIASKHELITGKTKYTTTCDSTSILEKATVNLLRRQTQVESIAI